MGLKEAILDRLEASNKNKVKYGRFIPNSIGILFYKQSKECKYMYCVLIKNKKESICSIKKWTDTGFLYTEKVKLVQKKNNLSNHEIIFKKLEDIQCI